MTALAQVISTIVHHNGSSDNGVGAKQLDQSILLGSLGHTLRVGSDVAQVSNVSVVIFWGTVGLAEWVEVRASGSASIGVVTKSVNVEPSQSIWVIASDVPRNGGWLILR